jgi:hypothetical protein
LHHRDGRSHAGRQGPIEPGGSVRSSATDSSGSCAARPPRDGGGGDLSAKRRSRASRRRGRTRTLGSPVLGRTCPSSFADSTYSRFRHARRVSRTRSSRRWRPACRPS